MCGRNKMEDVNVISSKSWWRDNIKLLRSLHNIRTVFEDGSTGRALYSDEDIVLAIVEEVHLSSASTVLSKACALFFHLRRVTKVSIFLLSKCVVVF